MTVMSERPQPLQQVADDATRVQGLWTGISTAIVSAGLISLATNNLITAILGLIPGLLALIGTIFGVQAVATKGAPLVTPLSDPRDADGHPLVPAVPVPAPVEPVPAASAEPVAAPELPEPADTITRPTARRRPTSS